MGSFRFRRSRQVLPGVRLNLTKRGVGISAGTRFLRVSKHSSGSTTTSMSIPGTGVHYRDHQRSGSGSARSDQRTSARHATPIAHHGSVAAMLSAFGARTPRVATPAGRVLRRAATEADLPVLVALARAETEARPAAAAAGVLLAVERNHPRLAVSLIEDIELGEIWGDAMAVTLLAGIVPVPLVPGLSLGVPAQAALILACAYALNRTGRYARVLEWFPEVDPTNDATGALAVERSRACNGTRRFAAAREELAPVIRRTSRARSVRCTALEQRALANLGLGRRAQAREDVARIADLTPDFPSLRALRWLVER